VRVDVRVAGYLARSRALDIAGARGIRVTGLVSTAAHDRTLAALRLTALLLGLVGVAIAILLGVLWSSQVSRPVETLAAFSRRVSQGEWEEPLVLDSVRELETLVEALERMRHDLQSYRDRLVVSERQAAWSHMARQVAHEIRNPLTPIAISIADLQRSYQQRRPDFPQILEQAVRTVGEEVESLKQLLQEFADFARLPPPRPGPCRVGELLGDLEILYGRDVAEQRLVFAHPRPDLTFAADTGQLKRALVNLIKNGLEAAPGAGRVTVSSAVSGRMLEISVDDTGPGLSTEQRAHLFVPDFTTKAGGSGLGLTIVERIVSDHRGTIVVEPGVEGGTRVRVRLPLESGS
jgi:nitrogen fixation/metabolism regulation signal transduction histidine kinase